MHRLVFETYDSTIDACHFDMTTFANPLIAPSRSYFFAFHTVSQLA